MRSTHLHLPMYLQNVAGREAASGFLVSRSKRFLQVAKFPPTCNIIGTMQKVEQFSNQVTCFNAFNAGRTKCVSHLSARLPTVIGMHRDIALLDSIGKADCSCQTRFAVGALIDRRDFEVVRCRWGR